MSSKSSRHCLLLRVSRCGATTETLVPELSHTSQNVRMRGFVPPPLFFVHYPLLAPTSKGLSISPYVQRLTLHWITLSTLLMMAHKAETAVQGWSVDPMEAVILTHRVLAARSTVRLSESLAVGKSFSLVLWSLVIMVTAQAIVVILLSLHPQARG